MTIDVASEVTFLGGSPAHSATLAIWGSETADDAAPLGNVELVVAAGASVRRRQMPAQIVALADVADELVRMPAGGVASDSWRALSAIVRTSVELVARGRIRPGVDTDERDQWHLGPFDPTDVALRTALADAVPPALHCTPLPDVSPLRMPSREATVAAIGDAVADMVVRTTYAPTAVGHDVFAGRGAEAQRSLAADVVEWLRTIDRGADDALVALRLIEPTSPNQPFSARLMVQSLADTSFVLEGVDFWDASDDVLARFGDDADLHVLMALRRGSRSWPPMARLLDQARPATLELDDDEVDELMGDAVDALAGAGIQVMWPTGLVKSLTVRPVVSTPAAPGAVGPVGFDLKTVAQLNWRASLDGEPVTDDELKELADSRRSLVMLRGAWVRVDGDLLGKLREQRELSAADGLSIALGGPLMVDGDVLEPEIEGPIAELAERLRSFDGASGAAVPDRLDATLRPYQERGLRWLSEMASLGLGGVLADDMGLGKTIQVIALHLRGASGDDARPTLVVCPTTLMGNWERETNRFAPGTTVRRFHGTNRSLDDLPADSIVLATYGVVRRDADALGAVPWGLVVADEAQAIKNPMSRTARELRRIPAAARFALTGTPIENRLTDLWALLDWTTPGLLGSLERFRREIAIPIERDHEPETAEALATFIRPFLLRRRKTDPTIAPELPPKTETDRIVTLSAEQASLYRAVADDILRQVKDAEGIERRGLVLKLITALKQICNHPAQYLSEPGPLVGRSGKFDAATELLEIIADEQDAALVFTQYVAMGRILREHLAAQGLRTEFLSGSDSIKRREEMVDRFQDGGIDAFVISLKAGGTGLNLTRATHVVHFDRWWNPAVEDQASDRAWRIGQDRPVQVHRMVCEGTLEDRIATVLNEKRSLAESVIGGGGEAWISELGDDELADLISLSSGEVG